MAPVCGAAQNQQVVPPLKVHQNRNPLERTEDKCCPQVRFEQQRIYRHKVFQPSTQLYRNRQQRRKNSHPDNKDTHVGKRIPNNEGEPLQSPFVVRQIRCA